MDIISEHERALIDEAVADGRVTVCPPATFGIGFEPMSWREQKEQSYRKYTERNKEKSAVQGRRQQVLRLADGTRTYPEIGDILGVPLDDVKRDVKALRALGLRPSAKQPTRAGSIAQRAREAGVTRSTYRRWIAAGKVPA